MKKIIAFVPLFIASQVLASEDFSKIVESIRQRSHNAGLAVAVFRGNEILHVSTHGLADHETKKPVTENSLFMIGSTTKAMTATAAGFLVQDGLLTWDDLVHKNVTNFKLKDPQASEQATLRDLLLHRTGMPRHDFAWLSRNWTSTQYVSLLSFLDPSAPFRGRWQYQNLMYMTAGLMVGNAAHSTWGKFVTKSIFENLGMTQTRALTADVLETDELSQPHAWNGRQMVRIPARNIDGAGPAGSVRSSIKDMIKWVQFNLRNGENITGKSLKWEVMAEIHKPQIATGGRMPFAEFGADMQYAFGWIYTQYRGKKLYTHGGGIDGFLTTVAFYPEADLGVVVLTNGGDLPQESVALQALDYFIRAPEVDWLGRFESLKGPAPSLPANIKYPESYVPAEGSYSHPAYGTVVLKQVTGNQQKILNVNLNGGVSFNLTPWIDETSGDWKFHYSWMKFNFHFGPSGKIESLEANLEPSVPLLKFIRTPEDVGVPIHFQSSVPFFFLQ